MNPIKTMNLLITVYSPKYKIMSSYSLNPRISKTNNGKTMIL